ncbi:hypothetical protein, partial [Salmonella sp. 1202_ZJSL19Sal_0414]|uniref:hypothetical protein n=1 Tax=Salmonella sp. 1202_ZJSL19Sal_0414 TaxID=3159626 RepID=UPI003978BC09
CTLSWMLDGVVDDREVELAPPRTETDMVEKLAGVVPVPVAAMMEGSAWRKSHSLSDHRICDPAHESTGKHEHTVLTPA